MGEMKESELAKFTLDVNTKDIINQNWKSKPKIRIMWYNQRERFIFDLLERNSKFGLRRI